MWVQLAQEDGANIEAAEEDCLKVVVEHLVLGA